MAAGVARMTGKGGRRRPRRSTAAARTKPKHRGLIWRGIFVLALCAALLIAVDRGFGPIVRQFAATQARFLAVTTINQAINAELTAQPVQYGQLVRVQRSAAGQVVSLEMDAAAANGVSSRLTLAANAALSQLQLKQVRIPLGTVLGLQWLAGRGPLISFYIQPASYVESTFLSTLEGAGLNQTMHSVVLRMSVSVETFAAGYHTLQTVTSDMILAQTVIVGEVPQLYWPTDDTDK